MAERLAGRPGLIRQINRTLILDILQREGPLSRTALAAHTGVSLPSISRVVSQLVEDGLVQEVGAGRSSGGRRPILLAFNPRAADILAVDVRPHRVLGVIADLAGEPVLTDSFAPTGLGPDLAREVLAFGRRLVAQAGLTGAGLRGVGAVVPGIVGSNGEVSLAPALQWYRVPFGEVLAELSPAVYVENDVNAMLMGETWRGATQGARQALAVIVGSGVGAAMMVDGRLHRGRDQAAGEVGSWINCDDPLAPPPPDSTGAFERHVSVTAWAYRWRGLDRRQANLSQVAEGELVASFMSAMQAGDVKAQAVVRDGAQRLGVLICNMTLLVNPDLVVVGGEALEARDILLPAVQEVINRYSPYPAVVTPATLGDMSTILGAVHGVLDMARSSVSFVS